MSIKLESVAVQALILSSRLWQVCKFDRLPYELSGERLMLLHAIGLSEPVSTAGLAEIEKVASPTITRMAGELERHGLITRVRNLNDARGNFLKLSKKGRATCDRTSKIATSPLLKRLETLSTQERKTVENAVNILLHLCTDMPDAGRILGTVAVEK
jgi:DNA-binding MarR family transcriptional regulator